MGIPHLKRRLQPYALLTTIGCSNGNCSKDHRRDDGTANVIIDGPSLAYHLSNRILAQKETTLAAYDSTASYAEMGQEAIQFLGQLQLFGLEIKRIFFDGYLPSTKKATRIDRLNSRIAELNHLHAMYPAGLPMSHEPSRTARSLASTARFFSPLSISVRHRAVPAPPFLVPAVLDALKNSDYASRTVIVPGEADHFCAVYAIHETECSTILTNDSDLLVYKLRGKMAIAFFDQLELGASRHCQVLKANLFRTSAIAERLGSKDLQKFAFITLHHPRATFQEIANLSRSQSPQDFKGEESFRLAYSIEGHPVGGHSAQTLYGHPDLPYSDVIYLGADSSFLDPRPSELVLKASVASAGATLPVYLPSLIEDPTRYSAWAPSFKIRMVLYTFLRFTFPANASRCKLEEYYRKGQTTHPTLVALLPSTDEIPANINALFHGLIDAFTSHSHGPWSAWWHFALKQITLWRSETGKPALDSASIIRISNSSSGLEWEDIHLIAQVQGVLYSLRMLKQYLTYMLDKGIDLERLFPIRRFWDSLGKMPELGELFPPRGLLRLTPSIIESEEGSVTEAAPKLASPAAQEDEMEDEHSDAQFDAKPTDVNENEADEQEEAEAMTDAELGAWYLRGKR